MEIVYIMAISLQLAGAIVLIENFWGGKLKKTVVKALKESEPNMHMIIIDDGPPSITYGSEEQQKAAERVLRNRFAFIYIAVGYALGVIGDRCNKVVDMIAVICVAILLWIICRSVSKSAAKKLFKDDLKVNAYDSE